MSRKYRVGLTGEWYTVKLASTANVVVASALEAGDTIDGVVLVQGDRVLLKNQTTATENGIYVAVAAAAGAASRSTDWPTAFDAAGCVVKVTHGTANANTAWLEYEDPAIVGTASLIFIKHTAPGARV